MALGVCMKTQYFDRTDNVKIPILLPNLKKLCEENIFHERVVMWIFKYFMNCTSKAMIDYRMT